ncbi:MAG: hypothetical protein HYY16_05655, partial [Planctomycetes bacterium]|nr:hypothetical protein [Planctomycetota bacterium]
PEPPQDAVEEVQESPPAEGKKLPTVYVIIAIIGIILFLMICAVAYQYRGLWQ